MERARVFRPPMFHATIRPDADRLLRVSGEVVPYDLQVLREHVLARCRRGARVEVRLPMRQHETLRAALTDLDRRGIELIVQPDTSVRAGSE